MKNLFGIPLIIFCLLVNVYQVRAQDGHNITVKVDGFVEDEAYLAYYYWDKQYIHDTVKAENGEFTFEGEELLQQGIYLVVLPPENLYFELIIGEDQVFEVFSDTTDLNGNLRVEGSLENELFIDDVKFLAAKRKAAIELQEKLNTLDQQSEEFQEVRDQIQGINGNVWDARKKIIAAHPEMLYSTILLATKEPEIPQPPVSADGTVDSLYSFYYYKDHYFDEFNIDDERLIRTPVYQNKINNYIDQLTFKVPDSIIKSIDHIVEMTRGCDECFRTVVGNTLNRYASSKVMGMDAIYVHMVEKYYLNGEAFWADEEQVKKMEERALAISPTLIGRKAPNITMADSSGTFHTLHDIDADFTILYFWDYDCGHCKKKTPQLAEVYKEYKDKNVALYTVSINGALSEWKKSLIKYDLEGINVQDHERKTGFDGIYDIQSTPRLFVLDEDKIIRAKHIDVDQLGEVLDMFMEEKAGSR